MRNRRLLSDMNVCRKTFNWSEDAICERMFCQAATRILSLLHSLKVDISPELGSNEEVLPIFKTKISLAPTTSSLVATKTRNSIRIQDNPEFTIRKLYIAQLEESLHAVLVRKRKSCMWKVLLKFKLTVISETKSSDEAGIGTP